MDEETFKINSHFQQIAKHYFMKSFFFDFFAWVPIAMLLNLFGRPVGEKERLFRFLKLLRIPRLAELLDKNKFKQIAHYMFTRVQTDSEADSPQHSTLKIIYSVHVY